MLLSSAIISCSTQPKEENSIDQLYNQMTQEERIAQLHGIHLDQFFNDNNQLDTTKCKALLSNGVGHFSQFAVTQRKTPDQLRDMVEQMQQWLIHNTPNGIPALFHEEVLSGIATYDATVYPQQIGLACSFNPELAEKKTYQTATSLRKIGGCLALSPMVDIIRNPSFNRLEESYGEDAYLSSVMGVAFVKGLQHGDLSNGVAACTKHFLGYGGGGNAEEKELIEEILMPHETIIRLANSKVIMTGYHAIRDTKCVANSYIQKSILRDYLHFDGLTVSDYGSIDQLSEKDAIHRAAAAINAGNDVDFPDGDSYRYLQEAIQQKLVKQETLESAVKRVLKLKKELGLLNKKEQFGASGHIQFDTPEELQTAYQLASQSVVMLRNNGVLPIKEPKKIALVGPNANSMWAMLGDYSYHSMRYFWQLELEDDMHPHIVSLKEGLANKLPQGYSLQYSRGCDWTENVETIIEDGGDERAAYMKSIQNRKIDSGEEAKADEAIQLAAQSDVIIAAMGENVILCGENRDRLHLRLPGEQEQFVEKLIATGKPVVLILFGGRAQVISGIAEKCAAIIQAWYPGEEGGNALADILYGNISPSGKLSVSYPAQELHESICYNYGLNNDPRIAYPFGYGLSYTTFKYDHLQMENQTSILTDRFNVSCEITNTGSVAADEIVQLYLSPIDHPEHLKPIQLQGFKRVSLNPGETKSVHFAVSPHQLSYYNNGEWIIDGGKYQIKIGASSSDIRLSGEIELIGESQKMPLRTNYFAE